MPIKIALAGNPNCGKTTLFNVLTGSNQYVGNWPGVTVEKKEGKLKGYKDVTIIDLPGIYSLSPYTMEEVVTRNYLIDERPDVILNIVDGTSLERSLFLTTQLAELGIPVVIAINMMDVVEKNGYLINKENLARELGGGVVEISALKEHGIDEAAQTAVEAARVAVDAAIVTSVKSRPLPMHVFSGAVDHALAHIEEFALHNLPQEQQRWYSIKIFERDKKIIERLGLTNEQIAHIEKDIKFCEEELDDDSESIITTERYNYIDSIISDCVTIEKGVVSLSDRIDSVVTNRWLALPIFAAIMVIVYTVSITTVGAWAIDWMHGVFGEEFSFFGLILPGLSALATSLLDFAGVADWMYGLIVEGIIGGVGAVLGFVPQIFVLFIFLAFLESCGYMARIAFILDRIFRKFGLSGKSFIPILIGTGCGVPGIMASRTIESVNDRKMTIITTTFIPCSAKLPIIALISGSILGGAWWAAPSAYFIGITAIVCSGIILKKTKLFIGEVTPFVMELPMYHIPTAGAVFRSMWERGWSFIKKAGTIILLSTIFVWFGSNFGYANGVISMVPMEESFLAFIGNVIAVLFNPLGWGDWRASVATITGLIAKENVVSTFGILYGLAEVAEDGAEIWSQLAMSFTALSAFSFLLFNLLCAPCFAAIGAIRREMNNPRWFWFAIGYQTALAYIVSLCVYQIGTLLAIGAFSVSTVIAIIMVIIFIYMLVRKPKYLAILSKNA